MSSRCKWEIKDKAIVSNSNFFRFFFSTCGTGVRGTCVHDMCTGTLLLQVLLPGMVFLVFQIFSLRYRYIQIQGDYKSYICSPYFYTCITTTTRVPWILNEMKFSE